MATAVETASGSQLPSGGAPLYISARLIGPRGFESEVYDTPPWPQDQKVAAEELGPYVAGVEAGDETAI
jgi:hypothetical protein